MTTCLGTLFQDTRLLPQLAAQIMIVEKGIQSHLGDVERLHIEWTAAINSADAERLRSDHR